MQACGTPTLPALPDQGDTVPQLPLPQLLSGPMHSLAAAPQHPSLQVAAAARKGQEQEMSMHQPGCFEAAGQHALERPVYTSHTPAGEMGRAGVVLLQVRTLQNSAQYCSHPPKMTSWAQALSAHCCWGRCQCCCPCPSHTPLLVRAHRCPLNPDHHSTHPCPQGCCSTQALCFLAPSHRCTPLPEAVCHPSPAHHYPAKDGDLCRAPRLPHCDLRCHHCLVP